MKEEIKKVSEQIEKLQNKVRALVDKREKLNEEFLEQNKIPESFVGYSYIYRNNSYSCPQKKSDYWDEYCFIVDYKESMFEILRFSKDSNGMIRFLIESASQNIDGEPTLPGYIKQKNNLETKDAFNVYFEKLYQIRRRLLDE